MRGLTGLLAVAVIVFGMWASSADSSARLHCEPVHVPEPETCGLGLYLKHGYIPNRCRGA